MFHDESLSVEDINELSLKIQEIIDVIAGKELLWMELHEKMES